VNQAHTLRLEAPPRLTRAEFSEIVNCHATVASAATSILDSVALDLGSKIQESTAALQKSTAALNARIATLVQIQNVIENVAQVMVTLGSLMTFVAAPSVALLTAVVSAIDELATL